MDSLRERVAKAIDHAGSLASDMGYTTIPPLNVARANAAIAAFEAVLLSDEVVEAAAIEIHAEGWNGGKEWADVHPVKQDNYKQQARAALQAALAAAKGAEDEQEDCGCTSIDYGWYVNDGGIVNDIQCSDEGCPRANKGAEEGSE